MVPKSGNASEIPIVFSANKSERLLGWALYQRRTSKGVT
jgi:hypothetical protein